MTTILTKTANQIVTKALRLINEVDANQPVPASQMVDGLDTLNDMVTTWQAQDLHLWTTTEAILPLDVGVNSYDLGPNGEECGNANEFITTTFTALPDSNTITVASTTGMEGADDILSSDPTESTAGWTTVAGTLAVVATSLEVSNAAAAAGHVTRSITGLTVGRIYRCKVGFTLSTSPSVTYAMKDGATTLGSASLSATGTARFNFTATQTSHTFDILNGDAAGVNKTITTSLVIFDTTTGDKIGRRLDDETRQWSRIVEVLSATSVYVIDASLGASTAGDSIYVFPENIPRPLRILQVRRFTNNMNDEIEAVQWSRQQYYAQPNKTDQGEVNNWYYDPQLSEGNLRVWQTASDVDQQVRFTYIRPLNITQATADNPDFPSEWFLTLAYNLAVYIAPEYRIPIERVSVLDAKAQILLDNALGYDTEKDSLNLQPDFT